MCAKRKAIDKKKVLFSDEFYTDMLFPDMVHAVLVRCPFSYGKITSVEFAPKTKIPDGTLLLTNKDLGKKNEVEILGTHIPLLCTGEIAYKGEPVAILAGEDKDALEELKSAIVIKLDKTDVKETESKFSKIYNNLSVSLKKGFLNQSPIEQRIISLKNTLENFEKPRELIAKRKIQIGSPEEVFADSENTAFIVEGKWSNQVQYKAHKEVEGCIVQYKSGNLHIFTPSQWLAQTLQTVSEITDIPKDKIFITRTKISASYTNSLFQNGIFAALASLVAIKTGKSVKFSLSRSEQESFIENPSCVKIAHKTALDKNGILTAMEIAIDYDAGSFNPLARYILDRLSLAATGIYNCKNVKISAKAYKSHNPPFSQLRAMIDSDSFFAIENQIQKIAEITGFSPVDLRQMNKAGGIQKSTKPFTFSFGRANDAINAVAIRSDFKRKYTVSRLAERGRLESEFAFSAPLRGIGMACAYEGSGFLAQNFEKSPLSLQISVTEDKKIIVHTIPSSTRLRELWTKLILENIETEKRNILFESEINDELQKKAFPLLLPEDVAGNVSLKTILLLKCIESLKRKKIDGTPFSIKKSLSTARKKLWNQEAFAGTPFYNTAFGTCTVELELDQCTFREQLKKICVIIDGGKILNPKAAENVIHASIQHCLVSLVDGDALKCPVVSVQFTQSEEEPKQIGSLVYSILPAAYNAALSQAIAVHNETLPVQTDSIFKLMERHEELKPDAVEDEK